MFSLIITVLTIALVVTLSVATVYYGSSAFVEGSSSAAASTVMEQAIQINSYAELYATHESGRKPSDIESELIPTYMSAKPILKSGYFQPSGGEWEIENGHLILRNLREDICEEIGVERYFQCDLVDRKLLVKKEVFLN